MGTFTFRGQPVEMTASVDDIDLDAAELIENELGLDLRDVGKLPKIRMMKVLTLISVRRVFPDATLAEIGRVNVSKLADALAGAAQQPTGRQVEFTGTVELGTSAADATGDGEVLSPGSAVSEASGALTAPDQTPGA